MRYIFLTSLFIRIVIRPKRAIPPPMAITVNERLPKRLFSSGIPRSMGTVGCTSSVELTGSGSSVGAIVGVSPGVTTMGGRPTILDIYSDEETDVICSEYQVGNNE